MARTLRPEAVRADGGGMSAFFVLTLRILLAVAGAVLLVSLWQNLGSAALELGSGAPGMVTIGLRASRLAAIVLTPFALLSLAVVPRFWRFALIPVAWAIVATILIYPREFDFLF